MVDGWLMVKNGGLVDSFSALKRMVVAEVKGVCAEPAPESIW
jgi:hypothetical protein